MPGRARTTVLLPKWRLCGARAEQRGGGQAAGGDGETDAADARRGSAGKAAGGNCDLPESWRRMRDSNSRGVAPNTLSKRAP